MKKQLLVPTAALALFALLLASGCDIGGGGEYFPPATEILRVEVEPNPVLAGETVTFTCVIADSTEEGFRFGWNVEDSFVTTDTNQYQWTAPTEPGTYTHQVVVGKPEDSSVESVQEPFEVTTYANERDRG